VNLSSEQRERVNFFIHDEWVDESESRTESNLNELLDSVESPYEFDLMLREFNWGCGIAGIDAVIKHPKTDPATKLRAFWMAGPGYFCRYEREADIDEYELSQWHAIKFLQKYALSGLTQKSQIHFDPKNDEEGYDWTMQFKTEELKLPKLGKQSFYQIPDELYQAI